MVGTVAQDAVSLFCPILTSVQPALTSRFTHHKSLVVPIGVSVLLSPAVYRAGGGAFAKGKKRTLFPLGVPAAGAGQGCCRTARRRRTCLLGLEGRAERVNIGDTLGLYVQYFLAIANIWKCQCMCCAITLESFFFFCIVILEYSRPNQKIFPPVSLQITA